MPQLNLKTAKNILTAKALMLTLVTALVFSLSSCSHLPQQLKLKDPKVSVLSVRLTRANVFSPRVTVDLEFYNPNSIALPLLGMDYQFLINEKSLATAEKTLSESIPAQGSVQTSIDVDVDTVSVLSLLNSMTGREKSLKYSLLGNLKFSKYLPKMKFSREGQVQLRGDS